MYLSRIELNIKRRNTMKLLAPAGSIHGLVEGAFDVRDKRKLWRIDKFGGRTYLMILSEDKPIFTADVAKHASNNLQGWETKDYDPLLGRVVNGSVWQFRLVANPTKSIASGGKRGRVTACAGFSEQEAWLRKRSQNHGFELLGESASVVENKWHIFKKGCEDRRQVSIKAVAFEGFLKVVDCELFRKMLINGIGRGKAYGMGLMTIISP